MRSRASSTNHGDERGMGLLFGMIATGIVALIAWAMTTNGIIDLTISDHYRNYSAAFYAADAGVEQTLIDFKLDDDWVADLIDVDNWVARPPGGATLSINGSAITVKLDGDGNIVPGWYPMGTATGVGEAAYAREVYLPAFVAPGECDPTEVSGSGASGSESKDSSSKDSSSKDSSSKDSKSKDSDSDSDGFWASALDGLAFLATDSRFLVAGAAAAGGAKVDVCHIPPGNPDNAHTINVSDSALSAHMAHGDTEGACADDDAGSGGSKSGSSKSGSSKSGSSKSGKSSDDSQSMLDDPCSYLDDLSDSGASDEKSEGSSSKDSSSKDSSSKDSSSKDSSSKDSSSKDSSSKDSSSKDSSSKDSSSKDSSSGPVAAVFDSLVNSLLHTNLLFAPASMLGQKFPKSEICHIPPGNPDNAHTINVSSNAVSAHLAHGDSIGDCDDSGSSSKSSSSKSGGSKSGSSEVVEEEPDTSSAYVIIKVRSTGTRLLSQTVIEADLVYLVGEDGAVLNIAVQDWRETRSN